MGHREWIIKLGFSLTLAFSLLSCGRSSSEKEPVPPPPVLEGPPWRVGGEREKDGDIRPEENEGGDESGSYSSKNEKVRLEPWIIDERCEKHLKAFRWEPEEATIHFSIARHEGRYRIRFSKALYFEGPISFLDEDGLALRVRGHEHSAFLIEDDTLYFADYWPIRNGCRIAAYDLSCGEPLWSTELLGILYVNHSCYSNRVAIDMEEGIVVVRGHEAGGDYVECVDAETGNILAHRLFTHYAPKSLPCALRFHEYGKSDEKIEKNDMLSPR